jgi:SWI/SNF-related matrix-associated actin-dependent regulator of chromatin subfamily A3
VSSSLKRGPTGSDYDKAELQSILRKMIEANENCSICFDLPNEPVITPDGNLFCSSCISDYIDNFGICPVTRRALSHADLVGLPPGADPAEDEAEVLQAQAKNGVALSTHAAKTRQLIKFLEATESGVKSLVFSQVSFV